MLKIMIVEDEPPILEMLKTLIEEKNSINVVACANNGMDALEKLKNCSPDIIITDVKMPKLGGLELIEIVSKENPDIKNIIISGFDDFEYARQALRLNVYDYLLKPISPTKLFKLLDNLEKEIFKKSKTLEKEYIESLANGKFKSDNKYLYPKYEILIIHSGGFSSEIYLDTSTITKNAEETELSNLIMKYDGSSTKIWIIEGKYKNEKIVVFGYKKESTIGYSRKISSEILQFFRESENIINVVYSLPILNAKEIYEKIRNLRIVLRTNIIFGESNIFTEDNTTNDNGFLSVNTKKDCNELIRSNSFSLFESSFTRIIKEWEDLKITQLQLEIKANYIKNTFIELYLEEPRNLEAINKFDINKFDINKFLAEEKSYKELSIKLLSYFEKLFIYKNQQSQSNISAKNLVDKIEIYINENYKREILYKDFINKYGYNEVYITNLFKEIKGITPNKLIVKLRIEKAKDIMSKQSNILIKDLAQEVGYEDQFYFSRLFKEFVGVSPKKFLISIN